MCAVSTYFYTSNPWHHQTWSNQIRYLFLRSLHRHEQKTTEFLNYNVKFYICKVCSISIIFQPSGGEGVELEVIWEQGSRKGTSRNLSPVNLGWQQEGDKFSVLYLGPMYFHSHVGYDKKREKVKTWVAVCMCFLLHCRARAAVFASQVFYFVLGPAFSFMRHQLARTELNKSAILVFIQLTWGALHLQRLSHEILNTFLLEKLYQYFFNRHDA